MDLERAALLCDFDGTICPDDVGNSFFAHFAGEASREAVQRWQRGEIGSRECLALECAGVAAGREEMFAFLERFRLDDTFGELVRLTGDLSLPFVVVSDGLDFYIRHLLDRDGFGHLTVRTNRTEFLARGLRVRFPWGGRGCGRCGNCKGYHVREFREARHAVIYVGDGLSDRCAMPEADLLFARRGRDLEALCRESGAPHLPFTELGEVAGQLRSHTLAELRAVARAG